MKNKLLIILIFFFIAYFSDAQELKIGYKAGYASYQMNNIKEYQQERLADANRRLKNVKSTETFPGWIFQNIYIGYAFPTFEIGTRYDYLTTAGRNHLSDYSGVFKNDMFLEGHALGLYFKTHFVHLPLGKAWNFKPSVSISGGAIWNSSEETYFFMVYRDPSSLRQGRSFRKSVNAYIQFSVEAQFILKKYFCFHIDFGYQIDKEGKLGYSYEDSPYRINWSGIRASAGVGFILPLKNKKTTP